MKEQSLPKVWLIDFDNTLSDTKFNPVTGTYDMGLPIPGMKEAVNNVAKDNEIVIWTARPRKEHRAVRFWLIEHGILFDRISKKPLARGYVDDRAVMPNDFVEEHTDPDVIYTVNTKYKEDVRGDGEFYSNGDKF